MNRPNFLPRAGGSSRMLTAAVLLALSPWAAADTPAFKSVNGLIQLPNVRIETGSPEAVRQAQSSAAPANAMRAFRDPVTGQLREASPEEMASGPQTKAAVARSAPITLKSASGATMMSVDEDAMPNSVVVRDARGNLHMQCVQDHDHALDAIKAPAKKEVRNDR